MHVLKRVLVAVGVMILAAGCSSGTSDPGVTPTPSFGVAPTGPPVAVEPLSSIPGSTRVTAHGVGIDVPSSMTVKSSVDGDSELVTLHPGGDPEASVILRVFRTGDVVDDAAIDAETLFTQTQLEAGGVVSDVSRMPATWEGWPYAVAITAAIPAGDGSPERETLQLSMHDADQTRSVSVLLRVPTGESMDSDAYAALRTVRVDE